MPITKVDDWNKWVENNKDPYGGCCIKVAEEVMRLLDADPNPIADTHALICQADKNRQAKDAEDGGITGFMAGCVAQMVSHCHSRGDEFRRLWNKDNQIGTEGDRANESGGVLNPALLNIEVPDA